MRKLIYIAGSSHEAERGGYWSRKLRQKGHIVTSGWPDSVAEIGISNGLSKEIRETIALSCVHQLNVSTHVWMLLSAPPIYSLGTYWEFGYAYAKGIKLYGSGGDAAASVFTALNISYTETDEATYQLLLDGR